MSAPTIVDGFVRLERGAHPLAQPAFDVGRLDPDKRIANLSLIFKLSPQQRADRDALVAAVSDPASPEYRQWLTPESYAARFGAKPDDIARASAWLSSQGLDVHATPSRLGARITFSGTVKQLEAAFRTEMHRYKVGAEAHYAMASAPAVPAELSDIVLAIHNTHDFYPRPTVRRTSVHPLSLCPNGAAGSMCVQDDAGVGEEGIAPPDWASIYDVSPLYTTGIGGNKVTGSNVSIVIVGISQVAQSDLSAFWTQYGVTAPDIVNELVPNTGPLGEQGGAGIEAVLDTEWASSIAPGATIHYAVTGTDDGDVDDATYYAIEQNAFDSTGTKAAVMSESWGGCEAGSTPSDADALEVYGSAANLLGITYLAASGDDGAADCAQDVAAGSGGLYVNMPASFPGVTGVGGTGFATPGGLAFGGNHVASGYGAEAVWNEEAAGGGAGGGGESVVFLRPSYQSSLTACAPVGATLPVTVPGPMRQVPDVSFTAASGISQFGYFIECTWDPNIGPLSLFGPTGDCAPAAESGNPPAIIEIGGTSASTPSFAGVVALAGQASGGGRLGNINPLLYKLPPAAFHDIQTGNNEIACTGGVDPGCSASDDGGTALAGYAATAGYDCASGLGSLNVNTFVTDVSALKSSTTTLASIASTPIDEGTPENLSVTIATTGTEAVTGTVALKFESYLATPTPALDPFIGSYTIATSTISGGTTTGATATASNVVIPAGMINPAGMGVDVYAIYSGDANHLGSISPKVHVAFNTPAFCMPPTASEVPVNSTFTVAAQNGAAPVHYAVVEDTTSDPTNGGGSTIDPSSGAFVAGPDPGYTLVQAIDADGAETFMEVTVALGEGAIPWDSDGGVTGAGGILTHACGTADGGVTSDAGSGSSSGSTSGSSSGSSSGGAGSEDAGCPTSSSSGSSGCTAAPGRGGDAGLFAGVLFGLALVKRRRARR